MDEKSSSKDGAIISKVVKNKVEKRRGKPVGLPKSGGRVKGTPNKSTTAWSAILDSKEFNIAEEAIKLFHDHDTNNQLKFHILQFLSQYTTPAVKPREVEEAEPEQKTATTTDILKVIK